MRGSAGEEEVGARRRGGEKEGEKGRKKRERENVNRDDQQTVVRQTLKHLCSVCKGD